jgi:hypothetical protein
MEDVVPLSPVMTPRPFLTFDIIRFVGSALRGFYPIMGTMEPTQ